MTLVESAGKSKKRPFVVPSFLWHITSRDRLASIVQHGLDPRFCREPEFRSRGIYLAADASHALAYDDHHGDWEGSVLLRIEVAHLDPASFEPDDVDLPDLTDDDVTWQQGLKLSGQCKYVAAIPASAIQAKVGWKPSRAVDKTTT